MHFSGIAIITNSLTGLSSFSIRFFGQDPAALPLLSPSASPSTFPAALATTLFGSTAVFDLSTTNKLLWPLYTRGRPVRLSLIDHWIAHIHHKWTTNRTPRGTVWLWPESMSALSLMAACPARHYFVPFWSKRRPATTSPRFHISNPLLLNCSHNSHNHSSRSRPRSRGPCRCRRQNPNPIGRFLQMVSGLVISSIPVHPPRSVSRRLYSDVL